jgi:hypothetical protein
MIIEILFIMVMFLWFISGFPQAEAFKWTNPWFGFIAVLLLGLYLFAPGLRS